MPRIKVIKGDTYRGYPLYQGVKSDKGFNSRHLDAILAIGEAALEIFSNPVAFHIILESPSPDRLGNIPEVISRWDSSALYFQAREVRPRKQTPHIHLHVLCEADNCEDLKRRVYALANRLQDATLSTGSSVPPRQLQNIVKVSNTVSIETGEVLKTSTHTRGGLFHYLNTEFKDWFTRASYLAKIPTKDSTYRRTFTCTDLKLRATYQKAKKASQGVIQALQAVDSTRSTVDTYRATGSLYSSFNRLSGTLCPTYRLTNMIDIQYSKTSQSPVKVPLSKSQPVNFT